MSKSKLIKFKGKDFGVALDWQEFVGKKNVVRNKIKDTLKKKKHDGFGVKIEQDKSRMQVGFSNKELKGIPSLAKFLASKEEFQNSLVLLNFDDDLFWMCGITKTGLIESGSDSLYDKDEFISAVSGYVTLLDDEEEKKIMIAENDADLLEALIGDDVVGCNVEIFDEDEVLSGTLKNAEIELVFNAKVDMIKQLSTLGLMGAVLTSGYFFVYLEDPLYNKIVQSEISEGFYEEKSGYEQFLKDQDKKLSNSYEMVAKKEIWQKFNSAYTNKDIFNYIDELSLMFPIYLVEWELEDITFNDVSDEYFRISYKRIPNSYGNTQELKESVNSIMKNNGIDSSKYSFQNPSVSGDRLFVNIKFKEEQILQLTDGTNQKEATKNLAKLQKTLTSLTSSIQELESEVMEFSFMDKRFGNSLKDKEEEILDLVDNSARIYEDMKKERKKLELKEVKMPESFVSGSKSEVLRMTQSYSYYMWNTSQPPVSYPAQSKGSKKKGQEIRIYAKSTPISVNAGGNLDILGLDGLKNILLNESLLNKPYIKVNSVSFNLQTEEWNIQGEYYEKI